MNAYFHKLKFVNFILHVIKTIGYFINSVQEMYTEPSACESDSHITGFILF